MDKKKIYKCMFSMLAVLLLVLTGFTGCFEDNIGESIEEENIAPDNPGSEYPVPGNLGIITIGSIGQNSIQLYWTKSSDNYTSQQNLQYRIYFSTQNNISSVAEAEVNGKSTSTWQYDIFNENITGLTKGTVYYINIIVMDEDGNKSSYITVSSTTAGEIYLFSTAIKYEGDIASLAASARSEIDAICSSEAAANYSSLSYSNVRALISISKNDSISNMASNYGVPVLWEVLGSNGTSLVANNWQELLDTTIDLNETFSSAGVVSNSWWSGSLADGSFDSSNNCNGWTSNANSDDGRIGVQNKVDTQWIYEGTSNCGNPRNIVCVCW